MTWEIKWNGRTEAAILDEQRVVGSIDQVFQTWRVDVLWSGLGGDITFEAASAQHAEAFVRGVEQTMQRFLGTSEADESAK